MRKKLLRSRSGFEKPESREEAIMQNILGASNVLEPSESNIEEILKSILYNTPYTKEAEFEIEKILLAIKNNGTYDGECESRDMKILLAILRDSTYNEEAESRIEELFIEWLQQRSQIKVLEGVPPLTFTARGLPLINYLIEGNTVQNGTPTPDNPVDVNGVGVRTENLSTIFSPNTTSSGGMNFEGVGDKLRLYGDTDTYVQCINTNNINLAAGTYTISASSTRNNSACYVQFRSEDGTSTYATILLNSSTTVTFNTAVSGRIRVICQASTYYNTDELISIMINEGSTAKPYEPYGYKIPITCGGVTTDIYIGDSPLYDGDTISMTDTGIEIPTAYGNNVLTVDTAVQPSNVYIEYK